MLQYKSLNVAVKSVDEENYTIKFIFSTGDEDRHGEIVDQKSWILDDYLKNPVVLFAHDHSQPAVGKTVSIYFNEQGNLEGDIQFAAKEYDFANTLFKLYKGGYMRATSGGFMNKVVEYDQEGDKVTLKQNTLIEMSLVNVPANALALAKSKGIDTEPLEKYQNSLTQKEGRVLSAKNRTAVENAISALNQVLEADQKQINNQTSNDTAADSQKVETPPSKGVQKQKSAAKLINQAIRALLQEKRNLTN